jgi:metallo-beta-lactamase class B
MRALRCLAFTMALAACATHAPPASPQADVTLHHLRGPLYIAEDRAFVKENSMVYVGATEVTVIGATWTPDTAAQLHRAIREVTPLPVTEVILTNHHPDRAGGAGYWQHAGARVLATQQTAELLRVRWPGLIQSLRATFRDYPAIPSVTPDDVRPGDFSTQGGRVQAMHLGRSHTADGLFVYFPEERTLYGGCILKESLGNLDDADLDAYPATLARLDTLTPSIRTIVSGHGSPVHGKGLIAHYLALLRGHAAQARPGPTAP